MQRFVPVLLVDHLGFCRVPEHDLVLWAYVGHGFGIVGLGGLLDVSHRRNLLYKRTVAFLASSKSFLSTPALDPFLGLAYRTPNRWDKPFQPLLEHVVSGATL